jgi:hypothetical protein
MFKCFNWGFLGEILWLFIWLWLINYFNVNINGWIDELIKLRLILGCIYNVLFGDDVLYNVVSLCTIDNNSYDKCYYINEGTTNYI